MTTDREDPGTRPRVPGGFVDLPRYLVDAILVAPGLSCAQLRVVLAILRLTWGYFPEKHWAGASIRRQALAERTGMSKRTIDKATPPLIHEGMVEEVQPATGRRPACLRVNPRPEEWGRFTPVEYAAPGTQAVEYAAPGTQADEDAEECPATGTLSTPGSVPTVRQDGYSTGSLKLPSLVLPSSELPSAENGGVSEDSSESEEETLAGEILPPDDDSAETAGDAFAAFWKAYPNKVDRKRASTAWKRLSRGKRELATQVALQMAELAGQGAAPERRYILNPTTFLHGERWEDWENGPPANWCAGGNGGRGLSASQILGRPAQNSYMDPMSQEDIDWFTCTERTAGEPPPDWHDNRLTDDPPAEETTP